MKVSESCKMMLMVSEDYQYATMSAYLPTMSEIPLNGEIMMRASPSAVLTPLS
jgi:hypothetical protein